MEAVPKAFCTDMVAFNQDSDLQANQDHQKASSYNQIKAISGQYYHISVAFPAHVNHKNHLTCQKFKLFFI
jgi:hypothetical protein